MLAGAAAKSAPALRMEYTSLSGLQPNTRYDYEAGGRKGWFKTPPTGVEPFRFVLYGDVRTRHDVHRRVIAAILKNGVPDLVVHSGDLVENGKDSALWANFLRHRARPVAPDGLLPFAWAITSATARSFTISSRPGSPITRSTGAMRILP